MGFSDNKTIGNLLKDEKLFWAPYITGKITECLCDYLKEKGFTKIYCPALEEKKKGECLWLQYGQGRNLELSASKALFLGAAATMYGPVYSLGTVYRKETVLDKRHLIEFELLEAEWSNDKEEVLRNFIVEMVDDAITVFNRFIREYKLEKIFAEKENLKQVQQLDYMEVPLFLKENRIQPKTGELEIFYDEQLTDCLDKHAVWVTGYPVKASWRAKLTEKGNAMVSNLIFPGGYGEIAECSVREENSEIIQKKFEAANVTECRKWYLDAMEHNREIKCGFGLGIERFCSWLMDLEKVENTQMYPRGESYFKEA